MAVRDAAMRLRFVGLTLAGIVAAVPSAQPGIRIVARETLRADVIETTHYIQPTRTRVDTRIIPARSDAGGESPDRSFRIISPPESFVAIFRSRFCWIIVTGPT